MVAGVTYVDDRVRDQITSCLPFLALVLLTGHRRGRAGASQDCAVPLPYLPPVLLPTHVLIVGVCRRGSRRIRGGRFAALGRGGGSRGFNLISLPPPSPPERSATA